MTTRFDQFDRTLRRNPVLPVATVDDAETAVPLARALMAGGIDMIEITLRTPAATDGIRRIRAEVEGMTVGAGTVLRPADIDAAVEAGAAFLVSPGTTPALAKAGAGAPVPFLPGAASASEAMSLAEHGFAIVKFFPAEPSGGVAALKALGGPLPGVGFVPTGGVDAARAPDYLRLDNVVCVGGSWIAPADAVRAGDWDRIAGLARDASRLGHLV